MLERSRLTSKRFLKLMPYNRNLKRNSTDDVHIGPSDHVPWLEDRKWAYIRLKELLGEMSHLT